MIDHDRETKVQHAGASSLQIGIQWAVAIGFVIVIASMLIASIF